MHIYFLIYLLYIIFIFLSTLRTNSKVLHVKFCIILFNYLTSDSINDIMTEDYIDEEYIMKIRASHILVNTKEEAENLLIDIQNGIAFEDLAKDYSKCPSGRDGGDLRWFGKGMMVKPFEDAAFALKKGEISEPVETQFGWHLIKLTDKED